jgi:hypothetical protein
MQHEATAKFNRIKVVPPVSQGRNTHGTAEVQTEDFENTNMLIGRLTGDITETTKNCGVAAWAALIDHYEDMYMLSFGALA